MEKNDSGARGGLPQSALQGQAGEKAAADFLLAKGYAVLERNWRARRYELDLVCMDGDELVFVEVKTRGGIMLERPEEALTRSKMQKTAKAASYYLSSSEHWDMPCRFDLVAVYDFGGEYVIKHYENAFDATDAGVGW